MEFNKVEILLGGFFLLLLILRISTFLTDRKNGDLFKFSKFSLKKTSFKLSLKKTSIRVTKKILSIILPILLAATVILFSFKSIDSFFDGRRISKYFEKIDYQPDHRYWHPYWAYRTDNMIKIPNGDDVFSFDTFWGDWVSMETEIIDLDTTYFFKTINSDTFLYNNRVFYFNDQGNLVLQITLEGDTVNYYKYNEKGDLKSMHYTDYDFNSSIVLYFEPSETGFKLFHENEVRSYHLFNDGRVNFYKRGDFRGFDKTERYSYEKNIFTFNKNKKDLQYTMVDGHPWEEGTIVYDPYGNWIYTIHSHYYESESRTIKRRIKYASGRETGE